MNSSLLLSAATFIYALASVFYIGSFSFKKQAFARLGFWVIVIGLVANTCGILLRWMESYHMGYGHAPFSNMYESLVFFSWTTAALYVFVEFKYKESRPYNCFNNAPYSHPETCCYRYIIYCCTNES